MRKLKYLMKYSIIF